MNLQIATDILDWEAEDYEPVTDDKIISQSRWMTFFSRVYRNTIDGTFWEISWARGSTEQCDDGYEQVEFHQVEPKEVMTITYVPVKK